jgi:RHS repeat-associated protein
VVTKRSTSFTLDDIGAWNTNIAAYTGSATGTPILRTVNTYTPGPDYKTKSLSTTTLSNGLNTQTQYDYDSPWTGKPTSIKQWDYYSGSPSPSPSRETDYTYSYADLQQVTLKENGNQISQTTYAYTSTATATSGVPHHGTAIMPTPYLQSVTQWLNTGGASPVTNYTMDDTGMVTQVLDPNGHASSTNYQCSNSLPYQSTNALGHVTTYGYDCNSGAITSVKDPNDLANGRAGITYQYEAGAGRLQSISYPDGGQKTYSYPSAIEVDTAVIANPDPTINSQDIVDAFGRPSQHVQAGTSTETSYDVNGRVSSVTNPHYSTPSSTDGTTHINSYDGLDRPLTKTQPDNTTLSWSYPGNTVISTDEAGHQWQRTSDAFGRLTKVIEPNNAETDYAYNGFTTTVSQKGVVGVESARPDRIFTTDSLGRTVSVNAPENGTTTYGYDANGNLTLKVDPRGSDVHYDYDALNRLLNITYGWQPCPNRHFIYDQSTGWSGTQMNTIGRLSSAYTDPGSFPVQDYSRSDELFSYDAMGRTIRIASAFPSEAGHAAHELRAAYDLAGDMIRLTYPDGRVVNQSYDGASNLQSVVFDNWNGQHVGYSYVSAASYWPDGSPHTMTLGNGVVQTFDKNNRGQLAGISANAIGPALNATLFAKQFGYTSQTQSANNGNIMQATDLLKANRSQSFGYDQLNRLTSFSTQDATLAQTYSIDSFGNLKQAGTQNFQPIYTTGNRIQDGFGYDGNGNVNTIANPGGGTSYYSFDADDRFSVFNFADYYTYSALGDRVRKDVDNIYTEYQYFNGQVIAERGQDGNWTDYIYANGRKIARADSYDVRIHFTGTTCANCGQQYSQYNFPIASYTIQAGDKIAWRQYQQGAAIPEGGLALAFSDGSFTNWVTTDQDGQTMNADTTENAWHYRVADLSQHAGKTIIAGWINANAFGGSGNWEEWFSDIVFIRTDGTVVPIYHRQPNVSYTFSASSGITNPTFEINTAPNLGWEPKNNTTYYIADQVGSTQMTLTGGGWPISTTTFYPFGQEASTNSDPNHYRFASLERDGESGLDHATFRDYSSTQGRWMSPDPYLGSYDFANPQSFNRYSYVGNMPLIAIDPSGLSFEYDPVNGCWDDWDVSTNSLTLSGCTNSVPINGVNTGGGVGAGSGSSGGGGSHGNRSSKVNIANCASSFAQKTSIAGGLNNLGIGNKGGVGGFLTNALGGNAVSGIIDLFRNGGSLTDIAFSGTRLGMPGASDRLEKGISGVVQDATAAGFHSVISTGGELTTLTGTASTVGLTAGEYATGVGELKFGYDALTYLGATAGCALNIIR